VVDGGWQIPRSGGWWELAEWSGGGVEGRSGGRGVYHGPKGEIATLQARVTFGIAGCLLNHG
jgi:hypothetical protein